MQKILAVIEKDKEREKTIEKFNSKLSSKLSAAATAKSWSDLLPIMKDIYSFLKLNNTYNFDKITNKLLLGKRLAQTLNPECPGGLHEVTLDVYEILLKNIMAQNQNKLMEKLICQLAQYYLGIIGNYNQVGENEFHLKFNQNPISLYVELPEYLEGLCYSNIICGIMRGMLEITGFEVKCEFIKDKMKGDDINDIKITLVKYIEERFIDDEE